MENNPQKRPLFLQDWWWDSVAASDWQTVYAPDQKNPQWIWPVLIQEKWGFRQVKMPALTMFGGPIQGVDTDIAEADSSFDQLLDKLDAFASVKQFLYPDFSRIDALKQRGYSISRRHTYQIAAGSEEQELFANVGKTRKRRIKKGSKRYQLQDQLPVEDFATIVAHTYRRKKISQPYSSTTLKKLVTESIKRSQGKVIAAEDVQTGRIAAALLLVWDQQTMYYLAGGYTELDKSSEATSFLMWQGIISAAEAGKTFDFEGSMNPGVADFFKSFGARRVDYFAVEKYRSPLLKLLKKIRS